MTKTSDISEITDMNADGTVPAPAPDPTEYTEIDLDGPIPRTDPPGIRGQFKELDDDALHDQLEPLRAQRIELSGHAGLTREDLHERVDERAAGAKRRIVTLDRQFVAVLNRQAGTYPSPEHAAMRMMADPAWADGLHAAVDATPSCERPDESSNVRPPRPRTDQVSCFSREELRAAMDELSSQISARENELLMRARRRITHAAKLAERELEASLKTKTTTKEKTR